MELISKQKIVTGFWLSADFKNQEKAEKILEGTLENISAALFTTVVAKAFSYEP